MRGCASIPRQNEHRAVLEIGPESGVQNCLSE